MKKNYLMGRLTSVGLTSVLLALTAFSIGVILLAVALFYLSYLSQVKSGMTMEQLTP